MKLTVKAHLKFDIDIPTLDEIKDSDIPEPYTKEEWQQQLISDAIYDRCGVTDFCFVEETEP